MTIILGVFILLLFISISHTPILAQKTGSTQPATTSANEATSEAQLRDAILKIQKEDITKPEESKEKEELISLFSKRAVDRPNPLNLLAYIVQYAVNIGVPANTIILILLLPFLATLVAFVRHILGLPSLELLVPITLSITLIATGLTAGFILLITILIASVISRLLLKRIRIMYLPKMAFSLLVVSIFVFLSLTYSASIGILRVKQLSIFPVLIFIILSDKIVTLQLERSAKETAYITVITIGLGILGYILLSYEHLRNFIILYPEMILLLIPVNLLIGRYFGLRLTEYLRFAPIREYGYK